MNNGSILDKKELAKHFKSMKKVSFKNSHGEKFNICTDGMTYWLSGDEVNAMVEPYKTIGGYLPLFSSAFNIWSKEEIKELGLALVKLAETRMPKGVERNE
jgi:hypothetical protein